MESTTIATDKTVVHVTGSGASWCDECGGKLAYSWAVQFSDGSHGSFCSEHRPGVAR